MFKIAPGRIQKSLETKALDEVDLLVVGARRSV